MRERKKINILLVEDSADDAELLLRHISKGGFDVSHKRVDTFDGMQKALKHDHWHLCITDHNMPFFNSTDALKLIEQSRLDIPTVIVSGSIGEDIAVMAMKEGAHDYIMKDNLTRLVPAIERELKDAEARRAHKEAEAAIRYMAYHDSLTNLNNRNEFDIRLRQALQNAKHSNFEHIVLYLDLDQFKIINDTCGHIAGDELLKLLALRLKQQVRDGDTLARLGGDEFGILLENCNLDHARVIAEKLLETVKSINFKWANREFTIGVSIGMVVINARSESVEAIMSAADMACYAAKDQGRNRIRLYLEGDEDISRRRGEMKWVSKLKTALEKDQFSLVYQAIAPLSAKNLTHQYEFLIRLKSEKGELISPSLFIPAAERYDLMPLIDRWVINNVFKYLSTIQHLSDFSQGPYFINLSGASLRESGLFDFVREHLDRYSINPNLICFEVTETVAIDHLNSAAKFMEQCRIEGIRFALDDFGSGFCSFSYLKSIPIDYLKVDGGFVRNMLNDKIDCSIVESVNRIGHVAGLKTIAEFVESQSILDKLREIGIDYAQGYGIEKPKLVELI